jgi:allophanate hydrolase subunit 2
MSVPVLRVEACGGGGSIQDLGRPGWRRFGVPMGGCMDPVAAAEGNDLFEQAPETPVLEMFRGGQRFTALHDTWVALTGGHGEASIPRQRSVKLAAGAELRVGPSGGSPWWVLATPGGFSAPAWLGGRGALPGAGLGVVLRPGLALAAENPTFALPAGVAARLTAWGERRPVREDAPLPVWPGAHAAAFAPADRAAFFAQEWQISRQYDRVGARLEGQPLSPPAREGVSEPQPMGTVQIARDGRPLVILLDGPAVGGYPQFALLDAPELLRFIRRPPGARVRFQPVKGAGWPSN